MKNLLLLHGALASKTQFNDLVPYLTPHNKIHSINFSGHGGIPLPLTGYSFETFANDILTYLEQNKLEKINLFGYSMGGYAALFFAKKYPEKVEAIFTLNTKFNWDVLSTAKETSLLNAEKLLEKVPNYANYLMVQHGINMWKQLLQQTEQMMTGLTKDVLLNDEDFKQLNCPVLIGASDKDITATLEENYRIYKLLQKANFLVFPNTSHPFEKINLSVLSTHINTFFSL